MNPDPNPEPKTRRTPLEDVGRQLDKEVERLIAYLNDEVVPSVRNHSSRALRTASQKLQEFAEYLERAKGGSPPPPRNEGNEGAGL